MRGLGDLISHKSVKGSRQNNGPFTVRLTLGTVSREKTAVLLDFVQISPTPPNLDNLYNFFRRRNSRF